MELRAALEPWLTQLQRLELSEYPSNDKIDQVRNAGILWIEWDTSTRKAFEAMEPLTLYSRIDYKDWVRVLVQLWPEQIKRWRSDVMRGKPFRLGCHVRSSECTAEICERFLLSDVECSASAAYCNTRRLLEAALEEKCTATHDELVIPVRLKTHHSEVSGEAFEATFWRDALLLASTQATASSVLSSGVGYKPRWPPLFRIVEANFGWSGQTWSRKDLLYARQIAAYGVVVQPFICPVRQLTTEEATLYTASLQDLLAATAMKSSFAVSKSVVVQEDFSAQTSDGVFSAVLASQSVEEIRVSKSDQDVDISRLWQWIAIVVFSRDASGLVKRLTVHSENLNLAQVDEVERVLRDDAPLSVLFAGNLHGVWASSSKFLLSPPTATGDETQVQPPRVLQLDNPISHFRVIEGPNDGVDFYKVLLPGWGQAWVRRGDLDLSTEPGKANQRAAVSSEPTIALTVESFESSHEAVLLALLRVIGPRLRKIRIICEYRGYRDPIPLFTADGFRQFLRSCPALKELSMPGIPPSLVLVILECYREGCCRIQRLSTEETSEQGERSASIRLFQSLADPAHPISQHLTGLQMGILECVVFPAIASMLQHNRILENIQLFGGCLSSASTIPVEITTHDHEPLGIAAGPLGIQKKLAFLSVVQAKSKQVEQHDPKPSSGSVIQRLDSDIIVIIFQFAAKCRKRVVRIGFN